MRFFLVLAPLLAVACARPPERSAPPAASAVPAPSTLPPPASPPAPDVGREPLGGPFQIDLLEDDARTGAKVRRGVVAVPLGAREPRPIVVALHGWGDRPEWACGAWRGITDAYPFVVCPRGAGADAALGWSSLGDTRERVARAIAATRVAFPGWVQDTSVVVLAGFSMGGTQAALLAQAEPAKYRRVVLAETAYAVEPAIAFARSWAAGGGERALFLCTTPGCVGPYRRAARNAATMHVPTRLNVAGTSAHGMWPEVVQSMRRDWPWVVEDLEGWSEYVAPALVEDAAALPGRTESFEPR